MRSQMMGSVMRSVARTTSTPPDAAMERAGADAREVGEQRAEARAALEVAEEVRVRRVRLVDDRRRRLFLVRDEEVHLEATEPRRVLGIVIGGLGLDALAAAPRSAPSACGCSTKSCQSSMSAFSHAVEIRLDVVAEVRRGASSARRSARVMTASARRFIASSRAASNCALCSRTRLAAFSTSCVRRSSASPSACFVDSSSARELLGRERLAVEDRERLDAALHGADAEAEVLRGRLEAGEDLACSSTRDRARASASRVRTSSCCAMLGISC